MGRATIGDVAKLAKVSQSTVSRALRGMDKVNPATRRRIEEAADQLDFTLSKSAGALASGRTMRVLLLMSGAMNAWFNASMMRGVHEALGPAGYDVAPHAIHNKRELDDYFEALPKNRNADAIIIVTDDANGDPLDSDDVAADAAAQLLSSAVRPTGVCTETDNLAAILMKELRHQRIRIPEDMSIIGFDDSPTAQLTDLTTIHQDPLELGRVAATKTLALLQGHPLPIPHETQPLHLVLRDTTSRAPRD